MSLSNLARVMERYSLRVGVDDGTPTYGFGAVYKNMTLDYAYRTEDVGNNHRISVSLRFGASRDEQRARDRLRLEAEVKDKIGQRMAKLERSQITNSILAGDTLFYLGEYDKATDYFDAALLWDPENERAMVGKVQSSYRNELLLAQSAIDSNNFVEGLFHSKQALEQIPADSLAAHMVTFCSDKITSAKNTTQLMNELLRSGIDLYPDREFTKALSRLEDAFRIDKQNPLAKEYVQKCRANIQHIVHRNILDARELAENGNYDDAIRLLEKTLTHRRGDTIILAEIEQLKRSGRKPALRPSSSNRPRAPR